MALSCLMFSVAQAHDSRCDRAPYSVSPKQYPALIQFIDKVTGQPNTKMVETVCRMRFDGADRSTLYKLGFTDEQIDETPTGDLVVAMMDALKKLVDQTPDR